MDKTLISRRFAKAVGTYLDKADVQRYVASRMAELTGRYIPADVPERVLEIGCGTGMFTRMYLKQAAPEEMWLNDLCPEVKPYLADVLGEKVHFVAKDAETLAFPEGQDLIVSCSAVQWFDDLPRFFRVPKAAARGGLPGFQYFRPSQHGGGGDAGFGGAFVSVAGGTAGDVGRPLRGGICSRGAVTPVVRFPAGSVAAPERDGSDGYGGTGLDAGQAAGVLPELYGEVFG